jgi:signal-transduction protein with cAMP-binding, CBS, and nucleotidyltransferase domain
VGQVMTTEVHTNAELASVADAMAAMQTHSCRHLPVMRGSRVIDFLSLRDVMNHELAQKTEELDQMRAYISGSA